MKFHVAAITRTTLTSHATPHHATPNSQTRRKEKDVSSMFGEDITGNVGLTVSKSADIVVGYGRKNPNATRGRERRGKKSVKKRL